MLSISKFYSEFSLRKITLILSVFAIIAFANGLQGEYMIDDHVFFSDPKIQHVYFLPEHFKAVDQKDVATFHGLGHKSYYRPLAHILPMISYLAFGDQVVYKHIFNLILFIFSAISVVCLIQALFHQHRLSLLVGVLYVVHPINGLMINYLTASVFSFQIIVMSFSSVWFLSFIDQGKKRFLIGSLLMMFFALLCHEVAFVLPVCFLLFSYFLKTKELKKIAVSIWPYFLLAGGYFVFRLNVSGLQISLFDKLQHANMNIFGFIDGFSQLVFWIVSKLLWPVDVLLIWFTYSFDSGLWVALLAVVILSVFFLTKYAQKSKEYSLGLCWFLVGFIPVIFGSVYRMHIGLMIEPHWLYFCMIGFFVIVAHTLLGLPNKLKRAAVGVIIILLIGVSWLNNYIWSKETRYYENSLKTLPKGTIFTPLAEAYIREGNYDKARQMYEEMLPIMDNKVKIYNNLGYMAIKENDYDKAKVYFKKGFQEGKNFISLYHLGMLYYRLKDYTKAIYFLEQAHQMNSYDIKNILILAKSYYFSKNYAKSFDFFEVLLKINPNHKEAQNALKVIVRDNLKNDFYKKKLAELLSDH